MRLQFKLSSITNCWHFVISQKNSCKRSPRHLAIVNKNRFGEEAKWNLRASNQNNDETTFSRILFKFKKNVNIWGEIFQESGFHCLQSMLKLDIIVHNWFELLWGKKDNYFFGLNAWKTKGFSLEPSLKWLKCQKKKRGGALICNLRDQFWGQILNLLKILYKICLRPVMRCPLKDRWYGLVTTTKQKSPRNKNFQKLEF